MAKITVFPHGIFNPLYLKDYMEGLVWDMSTTQVVLVNLDRLSSYSYKGVYSGTFQVEMSGDITGRVNAFQFYYKTTEFIRMEGFDVNARLVFDLIGMGKFNDLMALLFSGNDVFHTEVLQTAHSVGQLVDASDGNDIVFGSYRGDTLIGGNGRDTLYGGLDSDLLRGGNSNDLLYGDAGHDGLEGLSGNDTIFGGWDNDRVFGGTGNDSLSGGLGTDIIWGGSGADQLYGGQGADRFVFKSRGDSTAATVSRDTIYDFSANTGDRIDLSGIDANTQISGNQQFKFVGLSSFRKISGELRYISSDDRSIVIGDINGDGNADFAIAIIGSLEPSAGWFYL